MKKTALCMIRNVLQNMLNADDITLHGLRNVPKEGGLGVCVGCIISLFIIV